jgi:hypothetical protein
MMSTSPMTTYIHCPRAKTSMTPCIARDGALALATTGDCVSCRIHPRTALTELAQRYPAAADTGPEGSPQEQADRFRDHVAAYVETKELWSG